MSCNNKKKKAQKSSFIIIFFSSPPFVPVLSPKLNHLSMHRVEISKESLQWWIAYHVALTVQMQPGALTLWGTIVLMANFTLKREESMQMIRVMTNGAHYHSTILLSFLQNSEIILCFMPWRGIQPVVCLFKARVKPRAGMLFFKYSFFVCVDACLTLPNMIFFFLVIYVSINKKNPLTGLEKYSFCFLWVIFFEYLHFEWGNAP